MKRTITILILPLFLWIGESVTRAQTQSGTDAKLSAEIERVLRDYYDAWTRMDEKAVMSMNAAEGFYYSHRNGFETLETANKNFQAYFKTPESERVRFTYKLDDFKVVPVGADAVVVNYKIVTTMKGQGVSRDAEERYTNVLAKRDGSWKMVAEHSTDLPKVPKDVVAGMPVGWIRTPRGEADRYAMTVDTTVKHGGNASASLSYLCGGTDGFGSLAQSISAEEYLGKRVRLSGWLRTENAEEAGLWMRLDGVNRLLGFDNMLPRAVKGTTEWKQYEVVLEVPKETVNILFGTLLVGSGRVWVDDMKLETVGKDVPTTNQLSDEQMKAETPRPDLRRFTAKQPANLSFEDGSQP